MAYIILLGIIKLQAFFKLVVKFVGRGLNIYDSVGVTVEIHDAGKKPKRKGAKVAAKYRNPDDASQTWTGRGVMPRWMRALNEAGRDKSEFLI